MTDSSKFTDGYRWTSKRKAAEVQAVAAEPKRLLELQRDHGVSPEEFASWQRLYENDGIKALRATRAQDHRRAQRRRRN